MCGEIDEQAQIGQDLLEQLAAMSSMLGVRPDQGQGQVPGGLAEAEGRAAYMESVFRDGLGRALRDVSSVAEDETVDAVASQAIALARLAGFLAGQLPPEADLFRAVIEAVSSGHNEPERLSREFHDKHGHHHHGHGHGADHHH